MGFDLREGMAKAEGEAAVCRRLFKRFIVRAWPEIDPAPLVPNWHIDAIADHLQAVADGEIKNLIINIPPGHAKSMLVSVLFPAWVWSRKPSWQFLAAAYEQGLVTRDAVKARDLMRSEWYTRWFRSEASPFAGNPWDFSADTDQKTYYSNTEGGHRVSLGVGGKGTGYRGDCLIIDDPISAKDAHSKLARDAVIRWKTETMANRFNDQERAAQILIMQRLHEEDLSGFLLREGGWEHLRLPSRFEAKNPCRTRTWRGVDFYTDQRKTEGELLFPEKFPDRVLEGLHKSVGSYGFAGQYQQRPAPAEGGMLKREWFSRRWTLPGAIAPEGIQARTVPTDFELYSIFVDAAFKKTDDSDKVAIGVFGIKGPDVYLLRLAWERMTFTETVTRLVDLKAKFPMVNGIFIEDKANGSAIIDTLKNKVPGIVPIEPDGGKESRIASVSPFIEAGNFWLPLSATWLDDFITEACAFPKAPHDDAIDMTAYALLRYCGRNQLGLLEALARD
jgi:predicted phage terminase large subunit-like protein